MGQQRFIVSAILILFVGFVIFIGLSKINFSDNKKPDGVIIDYDSKKENTYKTPMKGKALFSSLCAGCHAINSKVIAPPLAEVTERGPWTDVKKLYKYIRDPESLRKKSYVKTLRTGYEARHLPFPELTDKELDEFLATLSFNLGQSTN